MMPLLFIFLIIVVVKSLTLDGAIDGVRYILTTSRRYFNGRYSICVRSVILYVIIGNNWDDYLCKLCAKRNDNKVIGNFNSNYEYFSICIIWFSHISGFKTFGYEPQEGPGLLFKVLPLVFSQMGFGVMFYFIFLILFLFLCINFFYFAIRIKRI